MYFFRSIHTANCICMRNCIFYEFLPHQYGWQSSLQRTSLQEDTPPGGQASRRTRLQADTPPGDTPPADGQVKLGPLPPEDTPPEDKPPGDIPPVDKPPEDEPPGGHPSRPPGGQASSLKNCYVQIKGAT